MNPDAEAAASGREKTGFRKNIGFSVKKRRHPSVNRRPHPALPFYGDDPTMP